MGKGKRKNIKELILSVIGLLLVAGIIFFVLWLVSSAFEYLGSIPKEIAAPLITGSATIIVATITVMIGRYFERKKEADALYRDKKTEIYDDFLRKFFELFFSGGKTVDDDKISTDLVPFLREFTRKLVLWSGPEVIEAFVQWKDHLAKGQPDAQSLILTEKFLVAIRNDLRHPTKGLKPGFFAKLFLKNGNLFLEMSKSNPNVTLQQLAEAEIILDRMRDEIEN